MTDSITRDHRSKLLTRRVRAIIRAFKKNPKYLSDEKPNITWDELFIPPELYVNLKRELESLDVKESQQVQKRKENGKEDGGKEGEVQEKEKGKKLEKKERKKKARESQRQKMEQQIAKEKAKVAQSDKKKANTSQDKENPYETENSLPKRTVKTPECIYISSDDETDIPADVAKPPDATKNYKRDARDTTQDKEGSNDTEKTNDTEETDNNTEKNLKRKWTRKTSESTDSYIDSSADEAQAEPLSKRVNKCKKSIDDVPPCQRCTQLKKECIPNGFPAACKKCRRDKKTCNLAKRRNIRSEKPHTTTPSRNKKSIGEHQSSTEDDEDDDIPIIESVKMPIGQSETKTKPQSTKASNSMEEGSGSRTFELDHMKQQLKVSQDELHIAQQQLQLANSRIEVQQKLYESQRDLYEVQLASYRRPQVRGQGDVGKAIERA